jgi:septal ring factor EnvC (AmiA/AmiB activator)
MSEIIPAKEIKAITQENKGIIESAHAITVATVEQVDEASKYGSEITRALKALEDKRTSFTKPLNESLKQINTTFKQMAAPLEAARDHLRKEIGRFQAEERARIAKEEARRQAIADAAEKKRREADPDFYRPAPTIELERPDKQIGQSQTAMRWTGEVTDFSKLPDEYKQVNQVAINQAIRDGARDIPGVKIEQKPVVGFR